MKLCCRVLLTGGRIAEGSVSGGEGSVKFQVTLVKKQLRKRGECRMGYRKKMDWIVWKYKYS